jgi:hypothetical protein
VLLTQISLVQATANSYSLNAAVAFSKAGLLNELVTTLAYNPDGFSAQMINTLPSAAGKDKGIVKT